MPDVTASRSGVLTIPGLKMGVLGWLGRRVITVIILVRRISREDASHEVNLLG